MGVNNFKKTPVKTEIFRNFSRATFLAKISNRFFRQTDQKNPDIESQEVKIALIATFNAKIRVRKCKYLANYL